MRIGEFEVTIVSDGEFRVDGGAMFGVVPRPLWERLLPPDSRNRIRMGTNCVLARRGADLVLIEAGLGRKLSKKHREIYAVSDEVTLEGSLRAAGVEPAEVTHVVLTHLHFDHCGGATRRDETGCIVPTFPNARHWVQRGEWEAAMHPTPATENAYGLEDLAPLEEAGLLELIDGGAQIVPGVRVEVIAGHTRSHQVVRVDSGGHTLVFAGDLVPTSHHARARYNAAYDLNAEENTLNKAAFLERAAREGWRLVFYHDPEEAIGTVESQAPGNFRVTPVETMPTRPQGAS
jgi:glyoxylase-like metal-dependent hydrolase (beta-lactamase superfamily II)